MSSALANPYAPPGPEVVSLPVSPLPAGFRRFRLDPVAFRSFATATVLRRGAIVVPLTAAFSLVFAAAAPGALSVALVAPGLVTLLLLWSLFRLRRPSAPELLTYELLATPRVLRRTVAGMQPAEILRPEVTRVVETKVGLWLASEAPRRSLFVARAIDGYADVRAELATWRPIEASSGWAAWRLHARSAGEQGQRDAIGGTALAGDASLREELEMARAASSVAHQGYPAVQPRKGRRPIVVLVLWVLLIVMFLAIWQFLSPAPQTDTSHRRARPVSTE